MSFRPLILPTVNGVVWGGLVFIGFGLETGVEERVGGVALAQLQYYVIFPLLMVSISMVPSVLLSQTKWSGWGSGWSAITLFLVLPYLLVYTGGI
jgi:hypothetical protein